MTDRQLNIAILSTSQNAYSETFIQAHKNLIKGNVKYYYGSLSNPHLEGEGTLLSGVKRYLFKGVEKLKKQSRYAEKNALLSSWKKNKIDVILAEYGTTAAMYIDIIKSSEIPLVIHFHGYDATAYKTIEEFGTRYKEMFTYASSVISVSNVMYDKILKLGCPEVKLIKNTYGPNNLFFDIAPAFSKQQFIAIGRFTDKKAPYYTILAFNKVLDYYPKAKLIMAGNGMLMNTCENLVGYLGIQDSIKFVGVITPEEYAGYLKESLAFVQHSITAKSGDMEGTPLAVLESSAAGLPVISTVHAGIPEVIKHNETGFLVEEHDVDGMSEFMLQILGDVSKAKNMGASGTKFVFQNFSMKKHIDAIEELLQKAVK